MAAAQPGSETGLARDPEGGFLAWGRGPGPLQICEHAVYAKGNEGYIQPTRLRVMFPGAGEGEGEARGEPRRPPARLMRASTSRCICHAGEPTVCGWVVSICGGGGGSEGRRRPYLEGAWRAVARGSPLRGAGGRGFPSLGLPGEARISWWVGMGM